MDDTNRKLINGKTLNLLGFTKNEKKYLESISIRDHSVTNPFPNDNKNQ